MNLLEGPIGPDDAIELLQEAVAERGDGYVDRNAGFYVSHGRPSCLVGLALVKAGVSVAALSDCEGWSAVGLPGRLPILTHRAAEVFQAAQNLQDSGQPWGDALIAAKERASRFVGPS
jgi:hypothetical protein